MGTRRAARELALQALYQLDVAGEGDPTVPLFWSHLDKPPGEEEAERESARASRRGLGRAAGAARTLDRSARSARAADGPPESSGRPSTT